MSNIVASTYAADAPQIDGRLWVHEVHTDVTGVARAVDWLAEPLADLEAALAAHAAVLSQALHDQEVATNLTAIMSSGAAAQPTNVYSPIADNVAAVHAAYSSMAIGQALMTAQFLAAQSDGVLEEAYGMTADQVAALRALPTLEQQQQAIANVVS